jgi:hypothetical protein
MTLKLVGLIVALFISTFGFGQSDFVTWAGLEMKTSLTKKLDVTLEGQSRFDQNSARLKTAFISPGLKFNIHDQIRVGADYRLASIPFNNSTSNRIFTHRFTLDAEFRKILDLFIDKSRLDLTLRFRGTHEREFKKQDDNYLRARLKASYNIKKSKFEPNLSAEMFYHLNNQIEYTFTEVRTHHAINKFRVRFGVDYNLKKRQKMSLFGIYQRQLFSLENDFILGLSYSYEIKLKK